MEYWMGLTNREKLLVAVAGGLAVFVILYLGAFRPLTAYHAASERELTSAQNTHSRIARGAAVLSEIGSANAANNGNSQQPVRVAVSTAARATGVAISRLQPGEDGSLTVWVESIAPTELYRWMNQMANDGGLSPNKVLAQKSAAAGRLRVQLQFVGRS